MSEKKLPQKLKELRKVNNYTQDYVAAVQLALSAGYIILRVIIYLSQFFQFLRKFFFTHNKIPPFLKISLFFHIS